MRLRGCVSGYWVFCVVRFSVDSRFFGWLVSTWRGFCVVRVSFLSVGNVFVG